MKLRSLYHTPKGDFRRWPPRLMGTVIVGWTWGLAVFYSLPKIFRKPPEGSSRWKEYIRALRYNFDHEELWIPDENGWFDTDQVRRGYVWLTNVSGQCFSSTTRGDAEGVRFAPASEVLKHPDRWSYIEFEADDAWWNAFQPRLKQQVGKKYDFVGVAGFVIPFVPQSNKTWFCSEICDWIKFNLYLFDKRHKPISPRRSAMLLAQRYGEPIPL